LDRQAGALIGALIVTMLPIYVPDVLNAVLSSSTANNNAAGYAEMIYGALIIVFIIAAPQGIVGLLSAGWRRAVSLTSSIKSSTRLSKAT
jgi:branched-chain amino acid transport system permease protein